MKPIFKGKLVHRSMLFTAGHNLKFLNKAFTTNADAIIIDLEDAVPQHKKQEAREISQKFVSENLPDNRPLYFRINPLGTGLTMQDLDAVATKNVNGFVYPMAFSAKDIIAFDAQLSMKEKLLGLPEKYFDIIALFETPASILNLQEIAKASDRIVGLMFGSEDFLAEQSGRHGINARGIEVPRHLLAMTAKANSILAIDTPYVNVGDFEGLKKHISQAKDFGFDGMVSMSPRELPIIMEGYTPDNEEIKKANEIVNLSIEANKNNKGIVIHNGVFVSPPTLKAAKKLKLKADNIKKYEEFLEENKK